MGLGKRVSEVKEREQYLCTMQFAVLKGTGHEPYISSGRGVKIT